MDLWDKYQQKIIDNCKDPLHHEGSLSYWKDHLFATTLAYIIPLLILLIIPTTIYCFVQEYYLLIFLNIKTFTLTALLAFLPSISLNLRKIAFCALTYIHSMIILMYFGDLSAGLMFILGISIFYIIIFHNRYAFVPVYLSLIFGFIFTLLIKYKFPFLHESVSGKTFKWIITSLNLSFLITIFSFLLPRIFANMQTTIDNEKKLQTALNKKNIELLQSDEQLRLLNAELEDRVDKRTKDLEEAFKQLETFSYSISHDLQMPVRAINVFTLALEKEAADELSEKAEEYLKKIVNSTKKMNDLIQSLLKFSQINKQGINKKELSIGALINVVWSNLVHHSHKEIEFKLNQLPLVYGDGVLIQQVIENLLSNAIKYSSKNEFSKIEVGIKDDNVFFVKDNGVGFNMKNHDRIFNIFKRLHTDEEFEGTGVGLSIVKLIIEKHGGKIWADSQLGNGATFYFTLPYLIRQ